MHHLPPPRVQADRVARQYYRVSEQASAQDTHAPLQRKIPYFHNLHLVLPPRSTTWTAVVKAPGGLAW
jgi:hypothetical protein